MSHPPHRTGEGHLPRRTVRRGFLTTVLAVIGLMAAAIAAGPLSGTAAAATNTSQYKGVNWADARDNFVDGPIIPSGLSTSDNYATTYAKSAAIVDGFQKNMGANTIRFGINPKTVSSSWWNSYLAAFDAASDKGMNVMIAMWAPPGGPSYVTDVTGFYRMWDAVINKYGSNSKFYFSPMNEPSGYSDTDWTNFAAGFLAHYPSVPRGRMVIAGTGSDNNIGPVGRDSRLTGTLLSLHLYSVFGLSHNTEQAWINEINNHIAGYASRTIVTEFGVPMSTGVNYNGPRDGDNNISYFYAMTDNARNLGMGSIVWPGLRTGDTWSLEKLNGSGTNLTLSNVNQSGLDRVEWGWGSGTSGGGTGGTSGGSGGGGSVLRGTASGRCVDVPGAVNTNGTQVSLYDCNGGSNQSWASTSAQELKVYGSKCLDASGSGSTAGTAVIIWDCNGGNNQKWNVNSNGTITSASSGLCLDAVGAATANGTLIDLWTCTGGSNQKWARG